MKKITKTLAITGALMCASVGLVGCAKDDTLVNTSGTYVQTTAGATSTYVDNLDSVQLETNGSYKFKMNFEIENVAGEGKVIVDGHMGTDGNFDLNMTMKMNKESVTAGLVYDIKDEKIYVNAKYGRHEVKTYVVATVDSALEEATMLPITPKYITPEGIKQVVNTELAESLGIELAETEEYVKLKYSGTGEMVDNYFYIVFNKNGDQLDFAGVKCEINAVSSEGGYTGYLEFVPSSESVKTLTPEEKAEYNLPQLPA